MKTQIRKNVFETNSSSTHSICIAKKTELIIPKKIHFYFGKFGWECDTLCSVSEKASYLYTGLFNNGRKDDFDKIVNVIINKGVDVTYEEPIYGDNKKYPKNEGYIDHSCNLNDFLDQICNNEEQLLNFLFSPLSFIITGNDNDDDDVDINVPYEHDEYYKGN